LIEFEHSVFALDGPGGNAVDLGITALFVIVNVAARLADQLVAGFAMHAHGDEV